jgi:hypothetical protein
MAMSNYLANQLANATVRNTSYTSPASVYAALYSVAPTASTSGTELTGNGYARQLTTFNAPSSGTASSNVAVTFGAASGNNWPTVTAIAIVDASTSGNILYFNTIPNRNVLIGDSLTIDSGQLSITIV